MTPLPVLDAVSGWRLAPDGPTPAALWPQALLSVAMLDEVTGLPPATTPAASTTTAGLVAVASATNAGLVGQPLRHYLPGFIAGASVELSLAGAGYLPVTLTGTFGAETGYPGLFTPIDLVPVSLHRDPVTITGRTVSSSGAVRAGATISLDSVWLKIADLANPPAAPNLVSLAPPLSIDRDTTATIAAQPMTPAVGQTKTLLGPANLGDAKATLSDQVGLGVGSVIALDSEDPAQAEYLAVAAIASLGPGPAFPAEIALATPLIRPHAAGATAIPMTLGAAGAANAMSAAARAGDVALLTSAMTGLTSATTVVISGPSPPVEYHLASPIGGVSDADGYVALPPAHRVAQLRLRVHHPAEATDLVTDVLLPLGAGVLTRDFVFP
jgi:hypothetical protein